LPNSSLTAENVRDHVANGHLPLIPAVRDMLDQDAIERGRRLERTAETLVANLGLARLVLGRTAERLCTGEVEPSISDGLAAQALLARFAPAPDEDFLSQLFAALEVAQELLGPSGFEEFAVLMDRRLGREHREWPMKTTKSAVTGPHTPNLALDQ
jgi:hypothetical protein